MASPEAEIGLWLPYTALLRLHVLVCHQALQKTPASQLECFVSQLRCHPEGCVLFHARQLSMLVVAGKIWFRCAYIMHRRKRSHLLRQLAAPAAGCPLWLVCDVHSLSRLQPLQMTVLYALHAQHCVQLLLSVRIFYQAGVHHDRYSCEELPQLHILDPICLSTDHDSAYR